MQVYLSVYLYSYLRERKIKTGCFNSFYYPTTDNNYNVLLFNHVLTTFSREIYNKFFALIIKTAKISSVDTLANFSAPETSSIHSRNWPTEWKSKNLDSPAWLHSRLFRTIPEIVNSSPQITGDPCCARQIFCDPVSIAEQNT